MAGRKVFSLFGSIAIEGMSTVKKDLSAFDKELRLINKNLNRLGRDVNKAGKAITKNLTVPLGAAAIAAIKFGADFDKAMTNSLAIMGDVSDSMRQDLEQTARDVAKSTMFSATEAAEAYFFLASAGLDAAESMAALPKVAAFAQAGNFNLADATDLLTDAQSALGTSSENVEEHMDNMVSLSDVLVKANAIANASVRQFSESLTNKAGAALRLLNKDVEEGAAVLAVYADQGVKGADAGTQLNIVLRDLQRAAVGNKQGFADAGISVFDASGNMRNMADIVGDLEKRLGGMSDEQRRVELTTLGFTDKSISATASLIGTSEALREYESELRNAGGATKLVAEKQMQTFWAQMGLLRDKAIDLGLTLYEYLGPILVDTIIPAFEKLVKAVENVLAWFGEHKAIAQFVGVFVTMLAVSGPILLMFVKFLPLIKSIVALYKVLTAAQKTLNAVMSANPIGLIVIAVAALTVATYVLIKNWGKVKEVFFDVWGGIKYHFLNISSEIAMAYSSLIIGILKGINTVGKYVPGLNKGLDSLIKTFERSNATLQQGIDTRKAANAETKAAAALTKKEKELTEEAAKAAELKAFADKKATEEKKKQTLEEIEAARKLAKDRAAFEASWTEKHVAESRTRLEQIEAERAEAVAAADKLGADKSRITAYYDAKAKAAREADALAELKARRDVDNELEASTIVLINNAMEQSDRRTALAIKLLEEEKDEQIRLAEEAGRDTAAIAQTYANKKLQIEKDAAKEEAKIAADITREKVSNFQKVLRYAQQVVGAINSLWGASLEKRTAEIDKEAEQRKAAVEASVMSEESRALAIAEIDKEADARKLELQKENAKREKAMALFGILINTAMAVAAALTIPVGGIALAAVVAALGAAEFVAAAATPLPLEAGAYVKSDPGRGILAQIGEGHDNELVLPMKAGAEELAKNIMGNIKDSAAGLFGATSRAVTEVHNHFHVGTLIADEFGVKTLAKRIRPYTIAENQRTGA